MNPETYMIPHVAKQEGFGYKDRHHEQGEAEKVKFETVGYI